MIASRLRLILMAGIALVVGTMALTACDGAPTTTPVPTSSDPAAPTPTVLPPASPTPLPTPIPSATPIPPPTSTPMPEFFDYTNDVFGLSFSYPAFLSLTEEDQRVSTTVPEIGARLEVRMDILSQTDNLDAYTGLIVARIQQDYQTSSVLTTTSTQVGASPGQVSGVEGQVDGVTKMAKIYTTLIGKMGFTFIMTGDPATFSIAEGAFDGLVATAMFPGETFEPPETSLERIAAGPSADQAETYVWRDTPPPVFDLQQAASLTAVAELKYVPFDSEITWLWNREEELHGARPEQESTTSTDGDNLYLSTHGPAEGLRTGFYRAIVYQDGEFINFVPVAVVERHGAEFSTVDEYNHWADFMLDHGDAERGIYAANKALEIDPMSARAYLSRAWGYELQCNYPAAIADQAEAARLQPEREWHFYWLGRMYWFAFDHQEAINSYKRGLAIVAARDSETEQEQADADDAISRFNNLLALAYSEIDQPDIALAAIEQSLRINPDSASYLDTKAYALLRAGEFAESVETYQEALDVGFDSAYGYIGMGLAQAALNDHDTARMNLIRGLQLYDANEADKCGDPQITWLKLNGRMALMALDD